MGNNRYMWVCMLIIVLVAFSLYPNKIKIQFDTNGDFSDHAEGYLVSPHP